LAHGAPSGPDVFLSYAREDEARAGELAKSLQQRGFSVFWDREVPPGETWHSYIGEALANARCVVVAWSRHSIVSQWVLEEASEGRDRKVLVPVLLEAVAPPFGFRAIQAANLTDWRPARSSPAFDSLLRAVQRIVGGQAGSGTAPEAEVAAPLRPAPAEPGPKTRPTAAKPSARSGRRATPTTPPDGRASTWSRRTVAAMVVGLIALAGAGGIIWRFTQPGPEAPEPVAEAEPSTPEPGSPDPAVGTEAAVEPVTPAPMPTETSGPREEMRDCAECPAMVLVPAGEFTMGSPPDEPDRFNDEGPQRAVKIAAPFWVGKYEVTFGEWDACVAAGGCRTKPNDWGRDNRPVVNLSWNDAKEYVGWLSQKTGKTYRLLSEAEWEYAARAGTKTPFSLPAPGGSDDIAGKGLANCNGCGRASRKTAPAGSFKANEFGLYDTAGNVWEWVEDCWHDSYDGAPPHGSAWVNYDCSMRVLRSGAWNVEPRYLRSAQRFGAAGGGGGGGSRDIGFRVARTGD
jgi:formylglycine-generating enzyme required for sulfatase activity